MIFQFDSFDALPLRHAMSQRSPDAPSEGDVGYTRNSNADEISDNRARFMAAADIDPAHLTLGRQVHGDRVQLVMAGDRGRGSPPEFDAFPETDALITRSRDVALGIFVADCTPIVLYDPVHHALGVVHAGWRGTVANIAGAAVANMAAEFGSQAADLFAGIGPSIGPCCYEVGAEVIDAWRSARVDGWEAARVERCPRPHFDLWQANRLNLLAAGLDGDRIETAGICTRCAGGCYFSHRAAVAGERAGGRMIMVAQLT